MACFRALLLTLAAVFVFGADDGVEPDGTTALHWAVRSDDFKTAERLLMERADPNAANRYGVTPLSLAAANANAAMADLLLKSGAQPSDSILMIAARSGNADIVRMLLARGANSKARESSLGETALMWAAAANQAEAVRVLIERGADPNERSNKLAFPKDRFGLEGVTTVLPRGDWTALMYAAREGSLDAARALAAGGADLNAADPDGTTALVLAILNGHYDTAAMLAERGADPNIADSAGMAALYAAVDMNTLGEIYGRPPRKSADKLTALDLMGVLLDRGANPNAPLKSPTLFRAHTPGEPSLAEGTTPLMRAAKNGDIAGMRLLLSKGADPARTQKNGTTALMLAAGLGRGTGVFAKDYASEAELLAGVTLLLEQGVDVNAAAENGQTALHYAAQAADGIVQYLAEHGARLDAKDKQGRTPLDVAMGVGVRARIGGEPTMRQSTAAVLRKLGAPQGNAPEPRAQTEPRQ
jgi:ankyrin repeat protein